MARAGTNEGGGVGQVHEAGSPGQQRHAVTHYPRRLWLLFPAGMPKFESAEEIIYHTDPSTSGLVRQ